MTWQVNFYMSAFDWLRMNYTCRFRLANKVARCEFFKFFIAKDELEPMNLLRQLSFSLSIPATTTGVTAVENKIPDHSKYITTPEFNEVTAEDFTARLAQENLASKNDITNSVKKSKFC